MVTRSDRFDAMMALMAAGDLMCDCGRVCKTLLGSLPLCPTCRGSAYQTGDSRNPEHCNCPPTLAMRTTRAMERIADRLDAAR